MLTLWGWRAKLEEWYDVLAIWREWADNVRGRVLDCGHDLPEETAAELRAFFATR